eukprot:TRINITY_DN18151_c0_g1_i1.p1 TRINITY_DN18151_c0_g1~~TRINITY_DN18151_c0_g1_i1.p1  ORF type:complete len:1109 (+),score=209.33 TRINITY_DN18151_c0_g1_i1:498-3329(+)
MQAAACWETAGGPKVRRRRCQSQQPQRSPSPAVLNPLRSCSAPPEAATFAPRAAVLARWEARRLRPRLGLQLAAEAGQSWLRDREELRRTEILSEDAQRQVGMEPSARAVVSNAESAARHAWLVLEAVGRDEARAIGVVRSFQIRNVIGAQLRLRTAETVGRFRVACLHALAARSAVRVYHAGVLSAFSMGELFWRRLLAARQNRLREGMLSRGPRRWKRELTERRTLSSSEAAARGVVIEDETRDRLHSCGSVARWLREQLSSARALRAVIAKQLDSASRMLALAAEEESARHELMLAQRDHLSSITSFSLAAISAVYGLHAEESSTRTRLTDRRYAGYSVMRRRARSTLLQAHEADRRAALAAERERSLARMGTAERVGAGWCDARDAARRRLMRQAARDRRGTTALEDRERAAVRAASIASLGRTLVPMVSAAAAVAAAAIAAQPPAQCSAAPTVAALACAACAATSFDAVPATALEAPPAAADNAEAELPGFWLVSLQHKLRDALDALRRSEEAALNRIYSRRWPRIARECESRHAAGARTLSRDEALMRRHSRCGPDLLALGERVWRLSVRQTARTSLHALWAASHGWIAGAARVAEEELERREEAVRARETGAALIQRRAALLEEEAEGRLTAAASEWKETVPLLRAEGQHREVAARGCLARAEGVLHAALLRRMQAEATDKSRSAELQAAVAAFRRTRLRGLVEQEGPERQSVCAQQLLDRAALQATARAKLQAMAPPPSVSIGSGAEVFVVSGGGGGCVSVGLPSLDATVAAASGAAATLLGYDPLVSSLVHNFRSLPLACSLRQCGVRDRSTLFAVRRSCGSARGFGTPLGGASLRRPATAVARPAAAQRSRRPRTAVGERRPPWEAEACDDGIPDDTSSSDDNNVEIDFIECECAPPPPTGQPTRTRPATAAPRGRASPDRNRPATAGPSRLA